MTTFFLGILATIIFIVVTSFIANLIENRKQTKMRRLDVKIKNMFDLYEVLTRKDLDRYYTINEVENRFATEFQVDSFNKHAREVFQSLRKEVAELQSKVAKFKKNK